MVCLQAIRTYKNGSVRGDGRRLCRENYSSRMILIFHHMKLVADEIPQYIVSQNGTHRTRGSKILTDFQHSFTGRIDSKFVVK